MELADVCQRRTHLMMLCLHPLGQELIDKGRIAKCIGLLESGFRVVVNRSRVYPPLEGLPAIILARRLCGGVVDWRA